MHLGSWSRARELQKSYTVLSQLKVDEQYATYSEYREICEHIAELGHTSVKDHIDELRASKSQLFFFKQKRTAECAHEALLGAYRAEGFA